MVVYKKIQSNENKYKEAFKCLNLCVSQQFSKEINKMGSSCRLVKQVKDKLFNRISPNIHFHI